MCHSHICPLEDERGRCTHRSPGPRPCAVEDRIAGLIARHPLTDMLCPLCLKEGEENARLARVPRSADGSRFVCETCERSLPTEEWLEAYARLTDGLLDERDTLQSDLAAAKASLTALRRVCEHALARSLAIQQELGSVSLELGAA